MLGLVAPGLAEQIQCAVARRLTPVVQVAGQRPRLGAGSQGLPAERVRVPCSKWHLPHMCKDARCNCISEVHLLTWKRAGESKLTSETVGKRWRAHPEAPTWQRKTRAGVSSYSLSTAARRTAPGRRAASARNPTAATGMRAWTQQAGAWRRLSRPPSGSSCASCLRTCAAAQVACRAAAGA